jgi:hypothetical protein
MSTRLHKDGKTVTLSDPAHIDAYKAKGWTVKDESKKDDPKKDEPKKDEPIKEGK